LRKISWRSGNECRFRRRGWARPVWPRSRSGVNFINIPMHSFYMRECSTTQIPFYQQYYTQLEVMLNFYAVCSTPRTSKISINLQAQKLFIEHWWDWHLVGFHQRSLLNLQKMKSWNFLLHFDVVVARRDVGIRLKW